MSNLFDPPYTDERTIEARVHIGQIRAARLKVPEKPTRTKKSLEYSEQLNLVYDLGEGDFTSIARAKQVKSKRGYKLALDKIIKMPDKDKQQLLDELIKSLSGGEHD